MTFLDLSLFFYQCWIYEHFPTICDMRMQHTLEGSPLTRRWKDGKAHPGGVVEYMRKFDALIVHDVISTTYMYHKVHREFDETHLFSSHMRWETLVVRHLHVRCLLQYGYVQGIPRLVSNVPTKGIDKWFKSNIIIFVHSIIDYIVRVQHHA